MINISDKLKAKADLAKQEREITHISAKPGAFNVTRLVCGVELNLKESGKHWVLQVKKV